MGDWEKLFSVFADFNSAFFSCPHVYILKQMSVNFEKLICFRNFYRIFV